MIREVDVMSLIMHNLKVAVRNLMKYRFQTFISVISISIGIVTLAFTHSMLLLCDLPPIHEEQYYERAYLIRFKSLDDDTRVSANPDGCTFRRMAKGNIIIINQI